MSNNAFTEAVELAYAEVWRQGEYLEKVGKGEIQFSGGEDGQDRAYNDYWRESLGGMKVLGALLAARGEVGRRAFPMRPDEALPDAQQTWIRLMQWGISKGLTTQDKLDEVVKSSPQHASALASLGQDRKPSEADLKALAAFDAEKGAVTPR